MTPALRLRITTFAVLTVISFAVHGPSASSAVELGTLGRVSDDVLGRCTPEQVANPASADNAEPLYAFLDDRAVLSAFDTPQEYSTHVTGIHYADPVIGFATTAEGDTQRIERSQGSGFQNASPTVSSASAPGGAKQHASRHGNGAIPNIARQSQDRGAATGRSEADRWVNVASPTDADVVVNARPSDGGTTKPGNQPKPSPATGSHDANPVVDVAKADTGDKAMNAPPAAKGGISNPGKQEQPRPATGNLNPNPEVIIAKAGEDDWWDPSIEGEGIRDLIEQPDWVGGPTAGGSDPAAGCHSNGTCQAQSTTPSNAVPEPGSMALLGLGMIGLVLSRRRKTAIARQ